MAPIEVTVLRVFTDEAGRLGNALGVVDGASVAPPERQEVAAALGFSETVFVDDAAQGRLRIFTPATELPFAGHPTVGTAWLLHQRGRPVDRLVVPAGEVQVGRAGELTLVRARAAWVPEFAWHQLADPAAVEAADPAAYGDGQHYCWAWTDRARGTVRARMFAPGLGIVEDEATGAAALALTVQQRRDLDITQGLGSRISTSWAGGDVATVGGRVVLDGKRTLGG